MRAWFVTAEISIDTSVQDDDAALELPRARRYLSFGTSMRQPGRDEATCCYMWHVGGQVLFVPRFVMP